MSISARVSGAWRTITSGKVRIGNAWKPIASCKVYVGGAWKDVTGFAPAMTAAISPSEAIGSRYGAGYMTTNNVTCAPTGGVGPYTYSWAITSGTATATASTYATTAFTGYAAFTTETGVAQCTVTDANGTTATATVAYALTSIDLRG